MWRWLKWGAIGFVALGLLNGIQQATRHSRSIDEQVVSEDRAGSKAQDNEKGCRAWLVGIAAKGYVPSLDIHYENGQPGILVNPGPWFLTSFDEKEAIIENFECLGFHGQDKRAALSVFDAKTHRRLGYYDGVTLRLD